MNRLIETLRGCLSLTLIALSTALHSIPIYLLAILKLLPLADAQKRGLRRWGARFGESWIGVNNAIIDRYRHLYWQVELPDGLQPERNYFVNCNHQSWVDIVVLQRTFNHRIPFLRFFLKQQLIWVPLLGAAWWALDFPFMRRYTRQQIAARPELKRKDLETTQKMCDRLAQVPVSIMNFLEGTRLTAAKHAQQQSPFQHLLKPKAGGLAFTLTTLKGQIGHMLDVSIVYPAGTPSLWSLLCGRIEKIDVNVREIDIPDWLPLGDYQGDSAYRERLKQWLELEWQTKDALISDMKRDQGPPCAQI